MKIRNKTNEKVAVTGFPIFEAWEERIVTKEVGQLLLKNPFFEELKTTPKTKAKKD